MSLLPSLSVGVMPAADRGRVLRALREVSLAQPGLCVSTREKWGSSADVAAVRDGEVDAQVVVGPSTPPGLRAETIGTRERHLVVGEHHPLAAKRVIRLEDVIDLPTFRRPDDVQPAWRSYWLDVDARGGEPRYVGRSSTELDALVALGTSHVVGVAPQGWGRLPGLRTRPVADLSPAPLLLLTRPDAAGAPLGGFLTAMRRRDDNALSPAERRVTALVVEGLSDARIAEELSLSTRTVQCHVANARRRLGLRSRTHLASVAAQDGLA